MKRLRTLLIGDGYVAVYGGEAVHAGGEVVGRLRSAAFGYTIGRTLGTVYLPSDVAEAAAIEVDVFDRREPGEVGPDVLHDPTGARMRA